MHQRTNGNTAMAVEMTLESQLDHPACFPCRRKVSGKSRSISNPETGGQFIQSSHVTACASSLISCTVSIPAVIAFPTRYTIYFFVLRVIGIVHNPATFLLAHLVLADQPFQHRAVTQAIGKELRQDACQRQILVDLPTRVPDR
jgi:hypothetical protein